MERIMRWLREWDWRPLARLCGWLLIAALLSEGRGMKPWAYAASFLRDLALTWLLLLGPITHLIAIVAMGGVRAALWLDEAAYSVAERLTRPLDAAPSVVRFAAAFAIEVALVGIAWRHVSGLLTGVLR